jgi:hypothetical protein
MNPRHQCIPGDCDFCETRAEQIKADLDDRLTAAEEAELDDAYERRYGPH